MQELFFQWIHDIFQTLSDTLVPYGIPLGPGDWFTLIYSVVFVLVVAFLVRRTKRASHEIPSGVKRIIASAGDVSAGIAGAKKLSFIRRPADALVFLKVEENAIQQALSAVDYYANQGELDENMKEQLSRTYQARLDAVRSAIAKSEELRAAVETTSAVGKARSDYLRKLAAMSGTVVEPDRSQAGPASVGMPGRISTGASTSPTVSRSPPSGGPPSGGPPSGGPPSGGPPSGGPPSGGPPSGGPPSGGPPSGGPPSGGPPSGGPPSGGPPSGGPPSGGPPGGTLPRVSSPVSTQPAGVPRSSLQSEMLAEMERLKALMSGD